MKILEWNGEIGYDLWSSKARADLKLISKEDIKVKLSSVGGDIFEGADIMTAVADYKRANPDSKMHLELGGVAASMGSAIASSPEWETVSVETTTAYMIHRPSSFVYGDFDDMRARADFLEKANDVYAKLYSTKSGKELTEIQSMMKDTTWFFGQEIVDNGFADNVLESEQTGDKDMILTGMKNKFSSMCDNQAKLHDGENFDTVKAAAYFKTEKPKMVIPTENVDNNTPSVVEGQSNMEVPIMNEEELKKDHSKLYDSVMASGETKERDRVKKLSEMKTKEEYKAIPEVVAVLDKAILDGNSIDEAQTMMNAAMVAVLRNPNMAANLDSPEDLGSGDKETPVMKTKKKISEV